MKNRSSHLRCSLRKGGVRNFAKFTGKLLCQSPFFNKFAGCLQLYQKRDSGTVFSDEFCKMSENTFFKEYFLETVSYEDVFPKNK